MRRKGEDTPEKKQQRMPFVAKIKRDDPFRSIDEAEIHAMCRRIAAEAEYCAFAGWREDAGFKVYHFTTWAKARAMQHWIDRSGIAHRTMPQLGQTKEEAAADEREVIEWALATGAGRRIIQAYRQTLAAGDSQVGGMLEAYAAAKAAGRKDDGLVPAVELIIRWAQDNHAEWFNRYREVARPVASPAPSAGRSHNVVPIRRTHRSEPDPPRWRPLF